MKLTGAQVIAQAMKNYGVQYVAGVPGRDCLPLLDAFLDGGREIPFIQVMQSRSAVHLADGFHRACGCPMALIGGASGNDMPMPTDTNVMEAHSSAALLIAGRTAADAAQRAAQLPDVLQSAFSVLLASQPKPVQIQVPLDVQCELFDIDMNALHAQQATEPPTADHRLIEKAVALLLSSMRPAIFVGIETQAAEAKDALLKLATRLGAPVVTSASTKGIVPEDHSVSGLSAGRFGTGAGNSILARADMILVLGCKEADWAGVPDVPHAAGSSDKRTLIRVSLEPPQHDQTWQLDIHADVSGALRDMSVAISPQRSRRALSRHESWLATVEELKTRWLQLVAVRSDVLKTPFSAQRPISVLRQVMERDGVVVAGPGTALMAVQQVFRAYQPRTQLTCANSPVVGWAVSAAIGAKLAVPAKDVVCVVGDGDFLQSLPEMAVCVMHGLPLVFVVLNNCGHMSTRFLQQKLLGRHVGSEFNMPNGKPYSPDFSDIARSFGLESWRVEHESQLERALRGALSSGGPALVEILTAREDYASLAGLCGSPGHSGEKSSMRRPEGSAVE
ncbi:thiamine pyrophosphate-binding protein [Paraburkholderia dipogonis]|uniref:Thiamine pyrophosphate-binding protein n=1 Tax=Paraburkholderia dipogonis TaxID=1211383 RepID=A0A4Y8MQY9_9BURK|nr:thiamine pyrophosphate-binding protein [Paraburkholderia dipogonis]TFE39808.1 thiamine pyrophosphate-binding protein [Paraburkholderia dipogonis]